MHVLKVVLVAATALGGASLVASTASAMPIGGLAAASNELSADIQDVRWVCGPFRCWWRPGPYWGYRRWGWGPRWGYGWRRW